MVKWQPIETAPRDGTGFLLWLVPGIARSNPGAGGNIVVGRYRVNTLFGPTWAYEDGNSTEIDGASHWMPLPDAPEDE